MFDKPSYHPLCNVWTHMKDRCLNKDSPQYKDYGGRGISICPEWHDSCIYFISWALENGWENGLQLDRENNDGDYTPDNCRFVTRSNNMKNTRLIRSNNKSGYRGVYVHRKVKYTASVRVDGKYVYLGVYNDPKKAALARDIAVINFNLGLPLNFPELQNESLRDS